MNIDQPTKPFQITCYSETHLDREMNSSSLNWMVFDEPLRKDRTRNGGGLMVYISSILKYSRKADSENPKIFGLK